MVLNDRDRTVEHMNKWNGDATPGNFGANPEAYLSAKTASKADFSADRPGETGVQRVPIKLRTPAAG